MIKMTDSMIVIEVPSETDIENFTNISVLVANLDESIFRGVPNQEEKLMTDVWVGIVLALLVLACIACICSCIIYHRFQVWKRSVLQTRQEANQNNVEAGNPEVESLPSYTIVSGLPSYDEALQQLKVAKQSITEDRQATQTTITSTTTVPSLTQLSVTELFQIYRQPQQNLVKSDK